MLKIKDDVDLDKLKDYGFKSYEIVGNTKYKFRHYRGALKTDNMIIGEDRILHYNQMSVHNEMTDIIYDLIQAGLVEKVEVE